MKYLHHFLSVMIPFLFSLLGNTSITFSQWQNDVRLTNDPGWSTTSFNNAWCIAGSGDTVHIVWYDNRDGNYEIYYKRSVDGGSNWETDTRLTDNNASSELPSISVSGSFVHIVWYDFRDGNNEIYYKRSTDSGTNWESDVRLTNQSSISDYPCIAASGLALHVVWRDGRDNNWEVYYKNSTDGGVNWSSDIRLTNNSSDSFNPSLSAEGSDVHVVWYDFRDGNGEIYYKRSSDSGINWGAETRLTNNTGSSLAPSISVSDSDLHVVWYDDIDGNFKIYYVRSTDAGINWSQDTCITLNVDYSYIPSVAVFGIVVHVVWASGDPPLNREIYYRRSTDAGINWEQEVRLTDAPLEGWFPSVSISDSILHVVWRDGRDGNYEIYYKQNPTGNVTVIEDNITTPPTAFKLEQNYPNPFNPTTSIQYAISSRQFVSLKVYDVLGNEIETLVNEEKPVGTYEITWNAANLPSGVYFYQLKAVDPESSSGQGFIQTKKMILLR